MRNSAIAFLVLLVSASLVSSREKDESKEVRERRLQVMRDIAEAIQVFADPKSDQHSLKLIDRPLLRFNDAVRGQDGTLWAWGTEGRPAAFVEVWTRNSDGGRWGHTMVSTSTTPLSARKGTTHWNPSTAGLVLLPLPSDERPATTPVAREIQMKRLARRFTAYEVYQEDITLRLLPTPVCRYSGPELMDGAVFVFGNGNNPEVLLFIESIRGIRWQYGMAPCSSHELHAQFDGQEAWSRAEVPGLHGRPTDSFWLFYDQLRVGSDDPATDGSPQSPLR